VHQLPVLGRCDGDHLRPLPSGKLDEAIADPTAGAVHYLRLAFERHGFLLKRLEWIGCVASCLGQDFQAVSSDTGVAAAST